MNEEVKKLREAIKNIHWILHQKMSAVAMEHLRNYVGRKVKEIEEKSDE